MAAGFCRRCVPSVEEHSRAPPRAQAVQPAVAWRGGRRSPRRRRAPPAHPATLPQKGAESCASPRRPALRLLLRQPPSNLQHGRRISDDGSCCDFTVRDFQQHLRFRSGETSENHARWNWIVGCRPEQARSRDSDRTASRTGRCARQAGCDAKRSKHRTPGLRSRKGGAQSPSRRRRATATPSRPSGRSEATEGSRSGNAGGTARRGCPRGWDREREEAKAGVAPPSRRAPRDRRAGAPARGPAFAAAPTWPEQGTRKDPDPSIRHAAARVPESRTAGGGGGG